MVRTQITGTQIKDATVSMTADVTGILPPANGGTGNATNTLNAALLGNGTGALQTVAPGTAANVLRSDGTTWASTALVKGDVGLGNVDNTSNATERAATRTLSGARITPRVVTTASASTHTIDSDATDVYTITAQAAAFTMAVPSGTPTAGQKLLVRVKDNGTARVPTWTTTTGGFASSDIATLLTTTVISKTHLMLFVWDEVAVSGTGRWVLMAVNAGGY
jgi:hypothetical protein